MSNQPLTYEMHCKVRELAKQGLSNREIADQLKIHNTTVMRYRKTEPKPEEAKAEVTEKNERTADTWSIELPKTRIHTLEQLVEYCEIDLDVWEVERFIANKWEVGAKDSSDDLVVKPLFQIKAFLKKRTDVIEAARIIDRLCEKADKHSPIYPKITKASSRSGNIVEISPVDVHHGAHIWGKETGNADYDLEISTAGYKRAIPDLISRTDGFRPEKALLVFGHDQINLDNRQGSTEAGTPQDNDTRYPKVFDRSCDLSVWTIDLCLKHYGRVEVIMVPGNHDYLSTFHLGKYLTSWYRRVPNVQINNDPVFRKYWEYGVNMLMLTHGNKGKLEKYAGTMASEQPEMWGRTKWREAHTGDKHHRRTIELPGATVRILPSLRPPCAWSSENHFVGSIRAAEAFVWNKGEGMVGTAVHSILDGRK